MIPNRSTFPDLYAQIKTDKLLEVFDQGPARLRNVLVDLTHEHLKAKPRPGKWSIQEIVMHVADSEIMGAARIRQTYTQPGSSFAVYDQDVWANHLGYQGQDNSAVQNALKLFESLRSTTSVIFHHARVEDWGKIGVHAEHGEITLRNLLELYADHSERHIEQILYIRSLIDKTMEFQLLLEHRLY